MFIALVWAVFGPVCPTGESQRRKVHAYEFRLQNSTAPLYGKREAARQAGPRRGPDRALPPPPGRVSASLSLDLVLSYMGTAAALTDALAARAVTAATTRPRWVLSEQLRGRGRAGERRLPRVGGDAPRPTDVAVKPTKADRAGSLQDERPPPPVSQQISGAGTRVSMSRRKGQCQLCRTRAEHRRLATRGDAGPHEEQCPLAASARSPGRGEAPACGPWGLAFCQPGAVAAQDNANGDAASSGCEAHRLVSEPLTFLLSWPCLQRFLFEPC